MLAFTYVHHPTPPVYIRWRGIQALRAASVTQRRVADTSHTNTHIKHCACLLNLLDVAKQAVTVSYSLRWFPHCFVARRFQLQHLRPTWRLVATLGTPTRHLPTVQQRRRCHCMGAVVGASEHWFWSTGSAASLHMHTAGYTCDMVARLRVILALGGCGGARSRAIGSDRLRFGAVWHSA
jgi:hypothetical protein